MSVLSRLREILRFEQKTEMPFMLAERDAHLREMPGQRQDASNYSYGAPVPRMLESLALFAVNPWIYTGVSMISEMCANAALGVADRGSGKVRGQHGLYDLLSKYGRPNDGQDVIEFFTQHIGTYLLARNSYWFWYSAGGGAPTEVFQLDPREVMVMPGTGNRVSGYLLRHAGEEYQLQPQAVTHFKGFHPLNAFYGLPIFEAGRNDYTGDKEMARWNAEYFDGPSVPDGIFQVPTRTTDKQIRALEAKFEAKHRGTRRSAVVRGEPGGVSWIDAGLKHKDLDFIEGRQLTRQVAYEMLEIPLGLLSASSTEAHARVAERRYLSRCWFLLERTASKLTNDALQFYSIGREYVTFEDIRVADWAQELAKWQSYKIRSEIGAEVPEG